MAPLVGLEPTTCGLTVRLTVAVPGIFVADGAASSAADRCHSLRSLHLPPAALPSLPTSFASLSRYSD